MNRWTVALPIVALGISLGGGEAARATSFAEALAAALAPSQGQHGQPSARAQKPAKQQIRLRHRLTLDSNPARAPRVAASASTPAGLGLHGPGSVGRNEALTPHSIQSVAVPPAVPTVTASPDLTVILPPEVDAIQQQVVALPVSDVATLTPLLIGQTSAPAAIRSTPLDLLMLIVLCVAVTTNSRRSVPGARLRPSRSKSEANLPIPIGAAVADVGAGSVEWLLPTPGGRTVGDGFAYAFAHHWGSTWNCRYSGPPAAAFRLPIAPQSTSRDVFQLDRVWPDLQVRLEATVQRQILIPDLPAA
jgi:hypothetical protein